MRAWAVGSQDRWTNARCGWSSGPPAPGAGEVLVRVRVRGVCRTDLHLAEGDLPVRRASTVPGHEVVGEVTGWGRAPTGSPQATGSASPGSGTCGTCRWCRSGRENLCEQSQYTGGTLTAATPSSPSCQRDSPTGCRTRSRTSRLRRCCARHHRLPLAPALAAPRRGPPASTASVPARTSPPRWPSRRGQRCTS